jgi:hypothetical protein
MNAIYDCVVMVLHYRQRLGIQMCVLLVAALMFPIVEWVRYLILCRDVREAAAVGGINADARSLAENIAQPLESALEFMLLSLCFASSILFEGILRILRHS